VRFYLRLVVALCAAVFLSACTAGESPPDGAPTRGSSGGTHEPPAGQVDPQVFQDVVESAFLVPGRGQLRAIRLGNYTQDLMFKACGGEGPPLDSTANRFMQQEFPDLELIRERGLTEDDAPQGEAGGKDCDMISSGVLKRLPAFRDVNDLTEPWLDIANTAMQDSSLIALKDPMWKCMTNRSSLEIGKNVPVDFLQAANFALSGDGKVDLMDLSVIYADCSAPYFDRLKQLLLKKRPSMVERNRELIERYASELVATGYVP
jgi:hypothetical protein